MSEGRSDRSLAPGIAPAYQNPGVAPGDYIDVIRSEADRMLREANGNRLKAINLGFALMRGQGLIGDTDLKRLERVAVIVFGLEQGKQSVP
jgi:hypothetical protein